MTDRPWLGSVLTAFSLGPAGSALGRDRSGHRGPHAAHSALADPKLLHDGAFALAGAQQPANGISGDVGDGRPADRPADRPAQGLWGTLILVQYASG